MGRALNEKFSRYMEADGLELSKLLFKNMNVRGALAKYVMI